jgi:hypothetical protein
MTNEVLTLCSTIAQRFEALCWFSVGLPIHFSVEDCLPDKLLMQRSSLSSLELLLISGPLLELDTYIANGPGEYPSYFNYEHLC